MMNKYTNALCNRGALLAAALSGSALALSGCAAEDVGEVRTSEQRVCSDSVYEAEDMEHQVGGEIADGWNVWSEGYIGTSHDFDGEPTDITVVAAGEMGGGQWPRMSVTIDGSEVANILVDSASWEEYSFLVNVPAGSHEVRIYFTNDYYQWGQDRNLLVDKMIVGCTETDPVCGDGVVDTESGEECDDGNTSNDDSCTNDCTVPYCGDGYLNPGEQCDDGNQDEDDGCTSSCEAVGCGNGIIDEGEECDDANDSNDDSCTNACTVPYCGDGYLNPGEQCDDANDDDTDGCTSECLSVACGDGIVSEGEECDDANDIDDDWCSNSCVLPVCGDGVVNGSDQCDDGNDNDNDECNNACQSTYCGDGIVQDDEECDDSDKDNSDECTNACTLPVCGDGIAQDGEECDDGNDDDTDGCTTECVIDAADGVSATLLFDQDWGAGYCLYATITNGADTATTSWTLDVDLDGSSIYVSWGGAAVTAGDTVTFTSYGWNSVIAPGASRTDVGFCANRPEGAGSASVSSVSATY